MRSFNPAVFIGAFAASMVLSAAGFALLDRFIVMLVVASIYVAVVAMLNARARR